MHFLRVIHLAMRKKTSIFWTLPKDELQSLLNECYSIVDVLKKMNMCVTGHQYKVIRLRIKQDNLDISHFRVENSTAFKAASNKKKISDETLFTKESNSNTSTVRTRIINNKIIPYQCAVCKNDGNWQGQPISLQLDHVNGIRNDHRIENLRFLCPNCHSQTSTFGSRNKKRSTRIKTPVKNNQCIRCKEPCLDKYCSHKCSSLTLRKFERPTKEELEKLVWEMSHLQLTKKLGPKSSNSIKKWCQEYGIVSPPRGYWARKERKTPVPKAVASGNAPD